MPKVKDKLKAAREKTELPTKEFSLACQLISQKKLCRWKGLAISIQSDEKQGPTTKITLSSEAFI